MKNRKRKDKTMMSMRFSAVKTEEGGYITLRRSDA